MDESEQPTSRRAANKIKPTIAPKPSPQGKVP